MLENWNGKKFKKEFKTSRISRSRASLFFKKSVSNCSQELINTDKILKLSPSKNKNSQQYGKKSRSLNSLGCSSSLSEFSSPISSISSISINEKFKQKKSILIGDVKKLSNADNGKFYKEKKLDKLKNLIGLMNGNLIKDYSDLLVDHENRYILPEDMNDESLDSILTDSSSVDLTDGTSTALNKLFKSDISNIGIELENLVQDEEKMLKMLIKILVRSCRIFDVATMKTDYKMSHWRYANPIIAMIKFSKKNKMVCKKISSVAVQTESLPEEEKNLVNIESECMMLSTCNQLDFGRDEPIYENQYFYKFWYQNPIYENLQETVMHDQVFRKNEFNLYENFNFFKDNNLETSFRINENWWPVLKKANYLVYDETLRDAENMSDLESDSDKWMDSKLDQKQNLLFSIKNQNMARKASGIYSDEKKNETKKINAIINPEIDHKNKPFRINSILSLSWPSSSSSMSTLTSNYSKKKLINSFKKKNFKIRPKSNNNDNDYGYYKKSRAQLKKNSNIKWLSRTGQQGYCLYKKDKNKRKFFKFIHIDKKKSSLAKTTATSCSNISAHRLWSMMHEYENTKSLETFLKKYESQRSSFKSEIKFKNLNKNEIKMNVPIVRTHSLDSLEDEQKNEEFTIECVAQPLHDEQASDEQSNAYTIGDLKKNTKFPNEENLIKQRARESLKFWKSEEEKLKQDTDQQNGPSVVQNSIFSSQNSFVSSLKRVSSRDAKSTSLEHQATTKETNNEKTNETDQQVPIKRVKDRINIFESKFQENKTNAPVTKIKKGSQSNFEPKSMPIFDIKPMFQDSKDIQARIDTFENNFELKSNSELRNEEFCSHSYIETNDDETVTSTKIIEFVQNVNDEPKSEQEAKSDPYDSDKNQFEETFFENQIIEYKYDKANDGNGIKISACSLDKQKTINLSLNSFSSEYVLEDDKHLKKEEPTEQTLDDNKQEINNIDDEYKRSSVSMQNSLSKSENNDDNVNESDVSDEEVEILIDLKNKQEKNFDENKINEILRNIVMHLIPTTRKAYVDDIVDGLKNQLSIEELDAIESPLDLPRDLIRFVQKRYSSLLCVENMQAEKLSKQTSLEIVVDSDRDSVFGESPKSPFEETTELTVVKEMREVVSDSESKLVNSNFIKVDEETLYIVEKIRQVKNKTESGAETAENGKQVEAVVRSNSTVENEIRKNFELKPKFEENLTKIKKDTDLKILVNDLKKSIFKSNLHFAEMQSHGLINEINDYQLHYFDLDKTHQSAMLVILFDKQNEDNLKYNLEQNYQKSIVDTHLSLNRKANINIVAHMNLYYIDDIDSDISLKEDLCESHASYINLVNNSKFFDFSIFKRLRDAHQLSHLTDVSTYFLPIGKYFIKVYYKHIIHTNDTVLNQVINETRTEKESIIDLSLLPLAIRAQLIYECEILLENDEPRGDLPHVNMMAVDSFLLQMEINKKRDNLIRNIIVNNLNYSPKQAEEFLTKKKSFNQMENLNEFITRLEADLDSYYICEKVDSLSNKREQQAQRSNEDLVKLNKLDALASFKCVQKYRMEILDIIKNSTFKNPKQNSELYQKFYLIDNGNHYKCLLPNVDLVEPNHTCASVNAIEQKNMSSSSVFMENIQKRQNYIFDKDLQNVFQSNQVWAENRQAEKNSDINQKNCNQFKKSFVSKGEDNFIEKMNQSKSIDLRQQVISNEVYKMFGSVRDHQSSTAKAKGEMVIKKKKKYGTWSYSSNKRHVIAKVMELPYMDDMSNLSKKTGITDLKDLEKSILNNQEDEMYEKVFVRIDDFLNKQVSQSIQRSYSSDYLNKHAGPKHRIKYVKIPSQELNTFSLPTEIISQVNEYRTAPYDLRYLSILKLLEEERLQQFKSSESIDTKRYDRCSESSKFITFLFLFCFGYL